MDAERSYWQPIVTDPDTVIAPAPPTPYSTVAGHVRRRSHGAPLYKDRLPPMRFLGVVR
jgi:hypothetical protein